MRILDPEHEEVVRNLLQLLASKDYTRYQAILMGLSGVLPAEAEEEMYRRRNVRLSEDGFLPYEEAVSVYTVLKKDLVKEKLSAAVGDLRFSEEEHSEAPLMPILHVSDHHLMVAAIRKSGDPLLLDRITMEFAGLCSQVFSAEGVSENTAETLENAVRKAASYVNVGLERWCGRDLALCERVLRENTLLDLFRSGFSMALQVRWETEQWLKAAWFARQGFRPAFWEEEWGATLVGVVQKRPLLFDGSRKEEPYRVFESLEEVETCRKTMRRLMVLDRLLRTLVDRHPLEEKWSKDPLFTFHSLLFNYWSR
ncbi:MAG: putative cytosolic protein, partial [Deltaproteobacteria bacterium]|nr:putative cytosolic protein [Deltaproteobacteria bacterium]